MYSTPVYLYQQKQQVLLPATDGSYFQRRWQPVYAKKLKVNRGEIMLYCLSLSIKIKNQ